LTICTNADKSTLQWHCQKEVEEAMPPLKQVAKIFTSASYHFSTVKI